MPTTSRTSRLALLALAATAVGVAVPTAASAAPDDIKPTTVAPVTVTEGQAVQLRIKLACERGVGIAPCTYRIDPVVLTAKPKLDFTALTSPARTKLKVKRAGRSMIATVTIKAVDDAVCEGTETGRIRVQKRTRRQGARRDYGTVTIRDNDCDTPATPQPAPQPAPAPAPTPDPTTPAPAPTFPADSGTPTVTTTAISNGSVVDCTTPQWIGTSGAAGADGSFNQGCAVKVTCPPEARVCRVSAEGRHTLERSIDGERVSLNSRITAFSAGDVAFFHRDQSSSGAGFTRTEDVVMLRGGESARNECNGVRITPTAPNRSKVGCTLTIEKQS
ncbi:hypothetical protein [Patulibacter minatonensis]|uniref:hypothetical protein n=1 Tax=Patulibacter minatonensis TaxID=298163 RepID=UPI00047922E5|nr:hypothetical protein [Patulibacter minatonensis]